MVQHPALMVQTAEVQNEQVRLRGAPSAEHSPQVGEVVPVPPPVPPMQSQFCVALICVLTLQAWVEHEPGLPQ